MLDTKRDDLTGQEIGKDDAWKIKIVQPNKLTLEIDCLPNEQIKNMVSVAIGNKQKWFKWKKDDKGALTKVYPDEEGF